MARARPGKAEPAVGDDVHALTARGHVDGADRHLIAHDNGRLGRAQLATRRNGRWCGCGRTDGDRDAVQQSAGDAAGPQLHSAAAALAAVHRQRSLRRRLHEPRARALAASPQYRSGVGGEAEPRCDSPAAPTQPSPSSTRPRRSSSEAVSQPRDDGVGVGVAMAGLAASPEVCKGLATRLVVVGVSSSQGGAPDLLAVTGGPAFHDYPEIGDVVVEPASLHIVGGRFRWVEAQNDI